MFLPKQQADAIVVTQLVTLGIQMHTRRLMRGDVLRKVALEDKCANVAPAQRTVDLGELTAPCFVKSIDTA